MLHTSAVPLSLLEVLGDLQEKSSAAGFALAGGTSLALRFGHRLSVDLDFFSPSAFDPAAFADHLGIGPAAITGMADGTLQLRVNGVKVEFLRHAYPKLACHDRIENLTLWSLRDVTAMKLNAICNRGSKKDFYDVAVLLDHHPLAELLADYRAKYNPASLLMVIRSLAWFEDADAEPDPVSLRDDSWSSVKRTISSAIRSLD